MIYSYKNQAILFRTNQSVQIDTSKIICQQDFSTPGVYVSLYAKIKCEYKFIINISKNICSGGHLLFWISDKNSKNIILKKINNNDIVFDFNSDNNEIINVGILFSGCETNDSFIMNNFVIHSNKNICFIDEVFINGYTNKFSYRYNEKITVYGLCDKNYENIQICNVGVYDINGKIIDVIQANIKTDNCTQQTDFKWKNGFGYNKSFSFTLKDIISGIYLIDNKIPFIVKSQDKDNKLFTIIYPINTSNAYNPQGGKNLYYSYLDDEPDPNNRAKYVSIHRPPHTNYYAIDKHSINFLKWIYNNHVIYDYNLITDIDMDKYQLYSDIKTSNIIIIGHSEYWTQNARNILRDCIDNGINIVNLSGNTLWWRVKYNSDRTVINCDKTVGSKNYKDSTTTFISLDKSPFDILGVSYEVGGFGILSGSGKATSGVYKIYDHECPIFKGTNLNNGDIIKMPAVEFDGIFCDEKGNLSSIYNSYYKKRLCALGNCKKNDKNNVTGIICLKKTIASGIVINCCSMDWCGTCFKEHVITITKNILDLLKSNSAKLFE